MARYKNYSKDDKIASIRMFAYTDGKGNFALKYIGYFDDFSDSETRMPLDSAKHGEKLMNKLGYKEY